MEMQYLYSFFGSEGCLEGPKRCYYTCLFQHLCKTVKDDIELGKTKHFPGKGKHHIEAVVIRNSITVFIPCKIADHFRFLVALEITGCKLNIICKDDLPSSITLKEVFFENNNIESLPSDLFDNTPSLEILSFRFNKIKFISYRTLLHVKRLKFADFRGNVNINVIYNKSGELLPGSLTLLSTLQAKIFLHCRPVDEQVEFTVASYLQSLWKGLYSDFQIQTKEETFNVHKCILAVNSPVFAAMFSHEMQENLTSEMTMDNFAPESIKEFLAFVYLRQIPQKCFNAVDLYAMSAEYQVQELSAIVQWFIIHEINVENASQMFKLGVLYNNQYIKKAAFEAIEKFFNKKLPKEFMESEDGMTEILEIKDKLDEILNRRLQSIGQSKSILETEACESVGETECKTELEIQRETECETCERI